MNKQIDSFYSQHIRDIIHGNIHFSETEKLIIDNRYFQRLRKVKQLGFLHLVFPCVVHTRFEHSLGVMHCASLILEKVIINQDRFLSQNSISDDCYRKTLSILSKDSIKKILRISALLHDIGHGPFSHASESLMSNISLPEIIKKTIWLKEIFPSLGENHFVFNHEWISLVIIEIIFQECNLDRDLWQDVLSVYSKKIPLRENSPIENQSIRNFLNMIISGDLDADRMDYLLRDSKMSGVKYGIFDYNHLLDHLNFICYPDSNLIILALDVGGIESFEHYLFNRYKMYTQLYHNKTNTAFEAMLGYIIDTLLCDQKFVYPIDDFVNFYDDSFVKIISNYISQSTTIDKERKSTCFEIIDDIFINRNPWKLIIDANEYHIVKNSLLLKNYKKKIEKNNILLLKYYNNNQLTKLGNNQPNQIKMIFYDHFSKKVISNKMDYYSELTQLFSNQSKPIERYFVNPQFFQLSLKIKNSFFS